MALMMQSKGSYSFVGTASSYFASKTYEAVTSQYTYRAIIYTNR
jgi:hypothetical protein